MSTYPIKGTWPGRLSIVSRPRGGDWLESDVCAWKSDDVNAIVSLLTPMEEQEFLLAEEKALALKHGLRFFSFPIPDMGVPGSRTDFLKLLTEVEKLLEKGNIVGVHCRQGIGRSGLIAAALLVLAGSTPKEAFALVSEARGLTVPETAEQHQWIEDFATDVAPVLRSK